MNANQQPKPEAGKKFAPNFVQSLLRENAVKNPLAKYEERFKKQSALVLDGTISRKQPKKRDKKKKIGLTAREKRELGVHIITGELQYEKVLPLNNLWLGYMEQLWGTNTLEVFAEKLLKADYHGCILTGTFQFLMRS